MEIKGMTEAIERAEDEYNAFAARAEDAPHKWGHEQNEQMERMSENLRRMYDAAGIDEMDRIAL
jgi:hypothetical protein